MDPINNTTHKYNSKNVYRMNIFTLNIGKGFFAKNMFIWKALKIHNIAIACFTDLGISQEELSKHFVNKGKGKYMSKGYVLPGYIIYVNELNSITRVAIAINEQIIDTQSIFVSYGVQNTTPNGRIISIRTKLESGNDLVCMCVYAPNEQHEHSQFMEEITGEIIRHKYKHRVAILAGDLNTDKYRKNRIYLGDGEDLNNEWPSDLNNILGDVYVRNRMLEEHTWQNEGNPNINAIIDYILVDLDWIDKCVNVDIINELKAISDHQGLVAYTNIPIKQPINIPSSYYKLIDVAKINATTIPAIQQDMCVTANTFLPILEDILNQSENEFDAIEFYNIVNKIAIEMQEIGNTHCAPDENKNTNTRSNRFGWDKQTRSMNDEIHTCDTIIKNTKGIVENSKNMHYTQFRVDHDIIEALKIDNTLIPKYRKRIKELQKEAETRRQKAEGAAAGANINEKWDKYYQKMKNLQEMVIQNRNRIVTTSTERIFPEIKLNKTIRETLQRLGITEWEQITNWDNTDLISLAALKRITGNIGIGKTIWDKFKEIYKNNIRDSKIVHPARQNEELSENLRNKTILLTIESSDKVRILNWRDVWSINWLPYGKRKFYKNKPGEWFERTACLVQPNNLDAVLNSIKAISTYANVYVTISENNKCNKLIDELVTNTSNFEWNKVSQTDTRPTEKIREFEEKVREKIKLPTDNTVELAIEYKKLLKTKIELRLKEMKEAKISKAINTQIFKFKRHPSKFIKNRRAMLEGGKAGQKLRKIIDKNGEHKTKEAVQNSTFQYYQSTGAKKTVEDKTKIDFIEMARERKTEYVDIETLSQNITHTEVLRKIFSSANNTAPGADGIPYELLKIMPDCFFKLITLIFNIILTKRYCPPIWKSGDVFLLAKTADPTEHKHWRPICLQATLYKILTAIIADRLLKFALTNNIISEEQKGFCPVSGCFDHAGLLLNIIENFRQCGDKELYLAFIDFTNAYGSVSHERLIQVIRELGFPENIVRFLQCTLEGSSYVVHTAFGPTQPIDLVTGLKQGDPSAPVLFILFIEVLIRAIKKYGKGYNFTYPFQTKIEPSIVQAFCDDVLVSTDSVENMNDIMVILEEFEKWSGMEINHGKCGVMAAKNIKGEITDLEITFKIRGVKLPYLHRYTSYKYLGNAENLSGAPHDIEDLIQDKLDKNIKLIDNTAIPPVYKIQLAEWLIASIPMYYLANGRVRVRRLKEWTKQSRQAVRRWLHMGNVCNSIIHVEREVHGFGIPEFEEIDAERKISIFTQFCMSNNDRIRESTLANLKWELGKRGAVIYNERVLKSLCLNKTKNEYTLLNTVESYLNDHNIDIRLRDTNSECFCVYPNSYVDTMFVCSACGKNTHVKCDKIGAKTKECARCRLKPVYIHTTSEIKFAAEYYQDNRYNWQEQTAPLPNPLWEEILKGQCGGTTHHIFRRGNGIWGVEEKSMEIHTTVSIKANKVGVGRIIDAIHNLIIQNNVEGNLMVVTNSKLAYQILTNWGYSWGAHYQRTTIGVEPATWQECRKILDTIKTRLPRLTLFKLDNLDKEPDQDLEIQTSKPIQPRELWLHIEGKQCTPKSIVEIIKKARTNKWLKEWAQLKTQGCVPRNNPQTIASTAYYWGSDRVDPYTKWVFTKAILGLLPTKSKKKLWGYTLDDSCRLCGNSVETIRHLLTYCPALKPFYKKRHDRIVETIAVQMIELENSEIVFIDTLWETHAEWKWNQPDLVLLAPFSKHNIPTAFRDTLKEGTSHISDVAVCWDDSIVGKEEFKMLKYEPLAAILNEEMEREGITVGALVFGVLGSVGERVPKELKKTFGLTDKAVTRVLREVNIILAEECVKIWEHVKLTGVFIET